MQQSNSEQKQYEKYAYIFDFDGVLADSMSIIFECFNSVFSRHGFKVAYSKFISMAGMPPVDILSAICQANNCVADMRGITDEFYALYTSRLFETPPIRSNVQLAAIIRASGSPVAIASGSPRQAIETLLPRFGLEVDVVVSSDKVAYGKPQPDVFLKAAELMRVDPRNCIVVEDSDSGITAAKAAGMNVLKFINQLEEIKQVIKEVCP